MSSSKNLTEPDEGSSSPTIAFNAELFPTPLRPNRQVTFPRLHLERNSPQGVAGSVKQMNILDVQHRSAPQINLDHPLVFSNVLQMTFRKHPAFVKHRDPNPQRFDEFHVVFDDHDGMLAGYVL